MMGGNMPEVRDPAIKLFGTTIPLPENQFPALKSLVPSSKLMNVSGTFTKTERENGHSKGLMKFDKSEIERISRGQEEEEETSSLGEDKVMKRPDKIVPCPRCNSLETKFCYFNNYNVNQPRHFCKNCQRYWTAGGSMRNVPVGAGRRRNKHLASQFRQIMLPYDGLSTTMIPDDSGNTQFSSGNGKTVLNFVHDEKKREPPSSCSSSSTDNGVQNEPYQCYAVPPWVVNWNPRLNNVVVPLQLVPAAYWGCTPVWDTSGNTSPTLGKHCRDVTQAQNSVLAPKTMRMGDGDDADNEALKRSIWASLGFQSNKKESKDRLSDSTPVLEANPAAHSRFQKFQEST